MASDVTVDIKNVDVQKYCQNLSSVIGIDSRSIYIGRS